MRRRRQIQRVKRLRILPPHPEDPVPRIELPHSEILDGPDRGIRVWLDASDPDKVEAILRVRRAYEESLLGTLPRSFDGLSAKRRQQARHVLAEAVPPGYRADFAVNFAASNYAARIERSGRNKGRQKTLKDHEPDIQLARKLRAKGADGGRKRGESARERSRAAAQRWKFRFAEIQRRRPGISMQAAARFIARDPGETAAVNTIRQALGKT